MESEQPQSKASEYIQKLEAIIDYHFEQLTELEQVKIGDLLKMLEIHKKLAPTSGEQKKFWEMVDQLRKKELPLKTPVKKKSGKKK